MVRSSTEKAIETNLQSPKSENSDPACVNVSLLPSLPSVASTLRAANLYLYQQVAVPSRGMAAVLVWAFRFVGKKAVTVREDHQIAPVNPCLPSECLAGLSRTDFQLPRVLRLQRYARVLPGPWLESQPHCVGHGVGALNQPEAPSGQTKVVWLVQPCI